VKITAVRLEEPTYNVTCRSALTQQATPCPPPIDLTHRLPFNFASTPLKLPDDALQTIKHSTADATSARLDDSPITPCHVRQAQPPRRLTRYLKLALDCVGHI
jgi:hypothetical protein